MTIISNNSAEARPSNLNSYQYTKDKPIYFYKQIWKKIYISKLNSVFQIRDNGTIR